MDSLLFRLPPALLTSRDVHFSEPRISPTGCCSAPNRHAHAAVAGGQVFSSRHAKAHACHYRPRATGAEHQLTQKCSLACVLAGARHVAAVLLLPWEQRRFSRRFPGKPRAWIRRVRPNFVGSGCRKSGNASIALLGVPRPAVHKRSGQTSLLASAFMTMWEEMCGNYSAECVIT